MTLSDCLPRFGDHLSSLVGLSDGTVKRYSTTVRQFEQWFLTRGVEGGADPLAVERSHVEEWLKHLYYEKGNFKNQTRATKFAGLKRFFDFLVRDGLIKESDNPIIGIPTPKIQKTLPQKFTTNQLQAIFSAPDLTTPKGIRNQALLTVLYGTGPRVNEVRNLNLSDIQFSGPSAYLHYRKTKGDKKRLVRLTNPEPLKQWLAIREAHVSASDPDAVEAVFISVGMGRNPGARLSTTSLNSILKRAAEKMGIKKEVDVFIHKMRSTFATDLYDSGIGLVEIQHAMGHESIETTREYIAISERRLRDTAIGKKRWKEIKGRDDSE